MIKQAERAFLLAKKGKKEQAAKRVVSRFSFRRSMKPREYRDYLEPIKEESSTFDMNSSFVSKNDLVDIDQPEINITPIRKISGKTSLSDKKIHERTPIKKLKKGLSAEEIKQDIAKSPNIPKDGPKTKPKRKLRKKRSKSKRRLLQDKAKEEQMKMPKILDEM